jgi:hypothetical protein
VSDDLTSRLLGEQRKRLIASIMGAAENAPWWGRLSAGEQRAFREKLLSSLGVFYDFCKDVVKVTNEDVIRNDLALDLINQVHNSQRALERELRSNGRGG